MPFQWTHATRTYGSSPSSREKNYTTMWSNCCSSKNTRTTEQTQTVQFMMPQRINSCPVILSVSRKIPSHQAHHWNKQTNKHKFCESESAMYFLMGDIIEISDETELDRDARQEYLDFLSVPNKVQAPTHIKSRTLAWWKENASAFPRIAVLAQFLGIPGTSVPSERAFSAAGLTLTKQRATLDSKTADAIIFLNKNLRGPLQKAAVAITDTPPFVAGEETFHSFLVFYLPNKCFLAKNIVFVKQIFLSVLAYYLSIRKHF